MPTYQYQCLGCSYEFEEFQQITEEPLTECPKCKSKVERIITGGAGLLFKGTGFYITDYRSERYKSDARKDTSNSYSPNGTKHDSKKSSDSKPTTDSKPKSDSSQKKSA
jgi:putative FmdB family regulatory protein